MYFFLLQFGMLYKEIYTGSKTIRQQDASLSLF